MRLFLLFGLLAITSGLSAQVSFQIEPRDIGINQTVQFSVVIEGQQQGRSPTLQDPNFGDFDLAGGPSYSSNMQIVNGQMTASQSYTYILRPKKKGTLRLPAIEVRYGGKTYTSQPTAIAVGDEVRSVSRRRSLFDSMPNRRNRRSTTQSRPEIFATLEVPKTEFYLGEAIPVSVKLYRTPGLNISNQGSSMNLPDFQNFWVEDGEGDSNEQYTTRDGKQLVVYTVDRKVLFPNRIGEIQIDAAEFQLSVTTDRGFFADWQTVRRQTEPVTINVKPLPQEGRPADFEGLVGDFTLAAELDQNRAQLGDSVSLRIEVTGAGNFNAITDMQPDDLTAFQVFEGGAPETEQLGRLNTQKTWLFALAPKEEGTFEIRAPSLSFFDPAAEEYRVIEADPMSLVIEGGEGLAPSLTPDGGGAERLDVTQDLAFIKLDDLGDIDSEPQLTHPRFLLFVVIGFIVLDLLLILGLFLHRRSRRHRVDYRPKFAHRNFKKNVAALKSDDAESFYGGLSQAIFAYFGDKWNRPGQGISLDMIQDRFNRDGVDEGLYRKVDECIEACDLARFTPSTPASREQLLGKAQQTIADLEEAL